MEVHPIFSSHGPRILSLMGALILLEPCWRVLWVQSSRPKFTFAAFTGGMVFLMLQGDWQGPSTRDARHQPTAFSSSCTTWPSRVCIPYCHGLCSHGSASRSQRFRTINGSDGSPRPSFSGLAYPSSSSWTAFVQLVHGPFQRGKHPDVLSGKLSLSGGCVDRTVALWFIAEQLSVFNWLSDLGRTSLTVYVLHFDRLPCSMMQTRFTNGARIHPLPLLWRTPSFGHWLERGCIDKPLRLRERS